MEAINYGFCGCEKADCAPVNSDYEWIKDPRDLYLRLKSCWKYDTCAPRLRNNWSEDNITLGQCSITAFLVQDIFGGRVYGIPREGGTFHCYNDVNGCVFDLTSEQFGEEAKTLVYEDNPEQFREVHFKDAEKKQRYELLKSRLGDMKTWKKQF